MKKSGSVLTIVLITLLALIIIGTSVLAYVNSTSKLNSVQNKKDEVELAANSILNLSIYSLTEGTQKSERIDGSYLENSVGNLIKNEELTNLNGFEYNIDIKKEEFDKSILNVDVSKYGITRKASKEININLYNLKEKLKKVEKFLKMNSTITILNDDNLVIRNLDFTMDKASFNIKGVVNNPRISGTTQFKAFIDNIMPGFISGLFGNGIKNIENRNYGFDRSSGLELVFGKSICYINRYEDVIKKLDLSGKKAYLLNERGPYKLVNNLNDITEKDLENSSGILINEGDGKYIILVNGILYIDGYIKNIDNTFMYATEYINIESWIYFTSWKLYIRGSSLVSSNGISIEGTRVADISDGEYIVDSDLKNILLKFTK